MKTSFATSPGRSLALLTFALLSPTLALAAPRADVVRDVQGYAIAACLSQQVDAVLKAQGEGWLDIIIQRGKGGIEDWASLRDAIDAALAEAAVPMVKVEGGERPMPLFQCAEMIDDPIVAAEIDATIEKMKSAYEAP